MYICFVIQVLLITDAVRRFCGKFNNIMAVLSKHSNEITTLHLVKSYCLPALLYGCEVWHLNDSSMQKISVAWNNCFRRIFSCCWRESVKPLQYFCRTLPISFLLHQRKLLFWKKLYCFELVVLQSLSRRMHQAFVAVGSLYNVLSPKLSNNSVKELICNSFTMSVNL